MSDNTLDYVMTQFIWQLQKTTKWQLTFYKTKPLKLWIHL